MTDRVSWIQAFAAEGATVIATDINKKLLEEQKKEIEDNANDKKNKEKEISSQKQTITVLTEQIKKEKEKATDLTSTQQRNKQLFGENEELNKQVKQLSVDNSSFTVHLEPGCGARLLIHNDRYVNKPSLTHPWGRA